MTGEFHCTAGLWPAAGLQLLQPACWIYLPASKQHFGWILPAGIWVFIWTAAGSYRWVSSPSEELLNGLVASVLNCWTELSQLLSLLLCMMDVSAEKYCIAKMFKLLRFFLFSCIQCCSCCSPGLWAAGAVLWNWGLWFRFCLLNHQHQPAQLWSPVWIWGPTGLSCIRPAGSINSTSQVSTSVCAR